MREFGPFIGFILLLIFSTVFSRKADQARRRSEEQKQAGAPKPPPGRASGGDDGETRFTDDLADEMLRDNAHLAKQLGTLQRWNRRS